MKKILTLLLFCGTIMIANAQSTGEIRGKVLDEKGEPLMSAPIQILDAQGKNTGRGTVTDMDGNYILGQLNAGRYDLKYSYTGYKSQIIKGILVSSDKSTDQRIQLEVSVSQIAEVEVKVYKDKLIDPTETHIQQNQTQEDIKNTGKLSVEDIAANAAGVTQGDAGGQITINGSRTDEVQYIVNGHRMMINNASQTGAAINQSINVPTGAIKEISVLAGGISAKYGDVTAGVVNITLQDAQESWGGNIEGRTTRGLDPYGTTRVDGSVYGPLIKIKNKRDSTSNVKRTLLGITIGAQYQQDVDRSPSAIGVWQVNPSVLNNIRTNPLIPNVGGGFTPAADYLTFADMYKTSDKPNNGENNYSGSAEVGLYPTKDISFTVGTNLDYDKFHSYVSEYSLLNAEHNPLFTSTDNLIYGRFTQRIGKKKKPEDPNAIKRTTGVEILNANYTVQVDYEKAYREFADQNHGSNLFDYGYIGKFNTVNQSSYGFSQETVTYKGKQYTGWVQNSSATDTAVIFTPSSINPLGSQFTKEYFQLLGAQENANGGYYITGPSKVGYADNLNDIQQGGALINGERSTPIYDLYYDVGRQYNGYGVDQNNQSIRGKIEGAFDIVKLGGDKKNTHKIELGIEYEQRIERSYFINPLELWTLGRNLVNLQLSQDTSNPIFRINNQNYTLGSSSIPAFYVTDSIEYGQTANLSKLPNGQYAVQSYFDRNLRSTLGLNPNGTDIIDFDAVDPNKLSLKLFSADELLSDVNTGLHYKGYDYMGNVLTYQPTTADYFTKKDANGYYTRPQGAFMPVYAAGYIQDKFFYKDLGFVVGLRIDRYDANQDVLKDKYSLYQVKTASQVTTLLNAEGQPTAVTHPADIGGNYAVYVDQNGPGQQITGYRNGDSWYDKYGRPSTGQLVSLASPNGVLPYLNVPGVQNMTYSEASSYITATNYDPSTSFTGYKPQYKVMPRLQFSFNITNQAQFFAHYDVLSQRPQNRDQLDLSAYYYFTQYAGIKSNPDLLPVTKTDYEFGFKQALAKFAAVTLSAFYQETRNLIDVRSIQYAFPATYTTYDNIDFRSAKGIRLLFDTRRVKNFKFNANYTLQFVEGTGDNDQAQINLLSANQPNFRTVYPLSTDNRHQFKFTLDYRFDHGKKYDGPIINNKQILADFGVNLGLNLRSGSPTRESGTVSDDASISSNTGRQPTISLDARLPWYSRVDLRVNKDFTFKISKKSESKEAKLMGVSIYLYIQNLLNTANVLAVYPYTLNANDDGYLKAPGSLVTINSETNVQAYKDLYKAKVDNPGNYSLPRRIYLGANINF